VLVLTVLVLSILIVLGCAFSFAAGVNRRTARNARDALRRESAVESALGYAAALLMADAEDNDFDTLDETWAAPEMSVEVGGELCSIRIVDEDRKLNVNRAVQLPEDQENNPDLRPTLKRLLGKAGGGDRDFDAISGWLDPRNPLPLISGLKAAPDLEQRLFEEEVGKPAINHWLTTHSMHININTASEEVLGALWDDFGMARAALDRRASEPFQSSAEIRQFLEAAGASSAVDATTPLLEVKSEFFAIYVSHTGGSGMEDLTALVRRKARQVEILHVRRGAMEADQ